MGEKNAVRFSLVSELVRKICTLDKGVMSTGVAQLAVNPPEEQVPLMVMMEEQRREKWHTTSQPAHGDAIVFVPLSR